MIPSAWNSVNADGTWCLSSQTLLALSFPVCSPFYVCTLPWKNVTEMNNSGHAASLPNWSSEAYPAKLPNLPAAPGLAVSELFEVGFEDVLGVLGQDLAGAHLSWYLKGGVAEREERRGRKRTRRVMGQGKVNF